MIHCSFFQNGEWGPSALTLNFQWEKKFHKIWNYYFLRKFPKGYC